MGSHLSQLIPPKPTLTEKNLPSQKGKVFLVTGGASGVGFALSSILYAAGGKVYIAGRSEEKGYEAIADIKALPHVLAADGELHFLHLDLEDLRTVKAAAEAFLAREEKLDVLWNNAGVMMPPAGSTTKQGLDLQIGTNCVGPYLFTQLLLPSLRAAARGSAPGSVRVLWLSSYMVDLEAPKGGFDTVFLTDGSLNKTRISRIYGCSKLGNWYLASELGHQVSSDGILSVTLNPGNLKTGLTRHLPWHLKLLGRPTLYDQRYGAYTELWAGFSDQLTIEMNGQYILPWGRVFENPRKDLLDSVKSKESGGTGRAKEFAEWCEEQTAKFK